VSRAEELRAALAVAEAEEAYGVAKEARRAGELEDYEWEAAKRAVTKARVLHRVGQGRPGSERYQVEEDGSVISLKERNRAEKIRDSKDNITAVRLVKELVGFNEDGEEVFVEVLEVVDPEEELEAEVVS
jgi:hypothetical protein